ncbi:hypothetical protein GOP47_0023535 [Adiantum capillus-veneris]|uniref:Uncharacterized protein n=1 Tax=Adiantum capillus-veneris TaxID=13818 RepID=A0A9D4Z4M1_ADICA|nr:hypothetical protein GOP47_0023535 [Adiantum capillus-veneris]
MLSCTAGSTVVKCPVLPDRSNRGGIYHRRVEKKGNRGSDSDLKMGGFFYNGEDEASRPVNGGCSLQFKERVR